MRKLIYGASIIALVLLFIGCSGKYRPEATGRKDKITVVMDSSMWHSQTADAIRQVFGHYVTTVPRAYHLFNLEFRDFDTHTQLKRLQRLNNLIFAAPIDGNGEEAAFIRALLGDSVGVAVRKGRYFHFLLRDQWYDDQWVLLLTSTSDSVLAQKIKNSKEALLKPLVQLTLQRYQKLVYSSSEQTKVQNKLWREHGWKLRLSLGWNLKIDTTYTQKNGTVTGFVTLHKNRTHSIRKLWVWWTNQPPPDSVLSPEWINQTRDSLLKKYIHGTRDSSYVTTDYKHRPVITDTLKINGDPAYETRGIWQMVSPTAHVAMGGSFVNMAILDQQTDRLFLLGIIQYAPKFRNKRRFIRRFRAILRTFQSDSTWDQRKGNIMGTE